MSEQFDFSVPQHVVYLAGYMDAVGRSLTTDAELVSVTCSLTKQGLELQQMLGVAAGAQTVVENWSREFADLVEGFLELNQLERLGFYLIDLICWFEDFTQDARCVKVDCEPLRPGTIRQVLYFLELEGNQRVLIWAQRVDKKHPDFLDPVR